MQRIVVVGNGIAGLTAADTLRESGFRGELVIIGDEAHQPYSRPALSKAALSEVGAPRAHLLAPPEHGGEVRLGRQAIGLDPVARQIELDSGERLRYDGLVIASGIRPRKLRPDLDLELTFRTIDDALRLRGALERSPRVVVIGAGVLGMELASACAAAGCAVTVVSRRQPLLAFFGEYLAERFAAAATAAGVTFVGPAARDVHPSDSGTAVELADGTMLHAELVITAIGDEPNVAWLADSGLLEHGELRVDSRGRVAEGVVAAGDVAALPLASGFARVPLWTSAIEQAKVAARALLFGDAAAELDFQPYFWTEQFGLSLKACGPLPVVGAPSYLEGDPRGEGALMRWEHPDGTGAAVALNYRLPVPKLRALAKTAPALAEPARA